MKTIRITDKATHNFSAFQRGLADLEVIESLSACELNKDKGAGAGKVMETIGKRSVMPFSYALMA